MTDTAQKRYSAVNLSSPWRGLGYFPTGTIDAAERLAVAYLYSGIAAGASVEVPDVIGETQAAGTLELETALFVVAVNTAYSDSVAVGLIISQSPVGGAFASEGSTVTITVSLGPQSDSTGGWSFLIDYELEKRRRRKEAERRRTLEQETEQIEDATDKQIAQLLRRQEAKDERRAELNRLRELARTHRNIEAASRYSPRVAEALKVAIEKGTTSALDRLDRELRKAHEEEEFMSLVLLLLVN